MPVAMYPDAELVICAWIRSIPGIALDHADWMFPWDLNLPPGWNGYAQVTVLSGAPDQNVPLFHTVAQIDCWTPAPSYDRIFRLRASNLAKQIQYGAYDRLKAHRGVELYEPLPDGNAIEYPSAIVYSAYAMSDPHQIQSPVNQMYCGYSFDMTFNWTCGITVK